MRIMPVNANIAGYLRQYRKQEGCLGLKWPSLITESPDP